MFALALACLNILVAAQEIPAFTGKGAEKAILVDIKSFKGIRDNVVLTNFTQQKILTATVYVYDTEWNEFGHSVMKHFSDSNKVESGAPMKFANYKYAAIVFDGNEKFSYKTEIRRNDLYFYFFPSDSYDSMKSSIVELDLSKVKNKFKDNIRFIGSSERFSDVGFLVFGDKGKGSQLIAVAYLKDSGDTCFVEKMTNIGPLNNYSSLSVLATNGQRFSPKLSAMSDDLYIYVTD